MFKCSLSELSKSKVSEGTAGSFQPQSRPKRFAGHYHRLQAEIARDWPMSDDHYDGL